MTNTERQAVKLMADEICRAMKRMSDENNRSYVGKQSGGGSSSQSFSGIISVSQISNLGSYISGLIGGAQSNAATDPNAQLIFSAISGIADLRVENATITTAQIEDLYASYGEFLHLVADRAEIGELNVEQIRADIAEMGIANIDSADIGFAQIKDLVSNTAIIREGLGGKLYIDRLAVTDAQILSLTTGNLIVQSTDGKLYSVYIDEDGEIHTELRVMSGDDIAEGTIEGSNIANNTITGALITENAITARELNVSKIFADDALIGAIKAGNIDTATLFADDAFISKLTTAIIQSPSIGENIDISKNSSISLTNERLSLMVESESNESKIILTDKMIQAIGDKFKIIADIIDLSGNDTITLTVKKVNEVADEIDLSGNTTIRLTKEQVQAVANDIDLSANKTVRVSADQFQAVANDIDFSGNKSISLIVGSKAEIFRGEKPPIDGPENSLWIQPGTGYIYQLQKGNATPIDFWIDDIGILYYTFDGEVVYDLKIDEDGELCISDTAPFIAVLDPEGVPIWWCRVKDSEIVKAQTTADNALGAAQSNNALIIQQGTKIEQTQEQIRSTAERVDLVIASANKNTSDISTLATRVSTAEQKITPDAIVSTVRSSTSYTSDISGLQQGISGAQNAANAASKTAGENATNIGKLATRMDSAEQKITAAAIVSTVRSSTDYVSDLNTLQGGINSAQSTASTAKQSADTNTTNIGKLTTRMSAAEQKITATAITSTVRSSTEYTQDIASLQQGINGAQSAANSASTAALNASNAASKAQTSANNAQSTADKAQANVDKAQADLNDQINVVFSEIEQTAERFEVSLNEKVGKTELRTYMRYEDGTLELGRSGSRYTTRTSDSGFEVLQDNAVMASMVQNTVSAPVVNAQRMFTIGDSRTIRLGASGHLIFN